MRNLKFIIILLISIQFTSCSKDSEQTENNETTNIIKFNNEEYEANLLYKIPYTNYFELILSDTTIPYTNYTGQMNFTGILFQGNTINEGTFTFRLDTDPTFDPNINFFDGEAGIEMNITNGTADTSSNYYENINSGTITISKNGDIYDISFNIDFGQGRIVEGNYSGIIN